MFSEVKNLINVVAYKYWTNTGDKSEGKWIAWCIG